MGSEIGDDIPERPLVTERLAALDSKGNDCKLARYVLYLERHKLAEHVTGRAGKE